jgi:two-component system alkaline phosphatase synthesis response regulator PhoP/two-component system response regulator VicR
MAKKILVIDDEPNVVKMVRSRLEAANYEVIAALNGKEGLEKVKSEKPDLIILDILMPQMDGYTFMREVRSTNSLKHIPIVILTAKDKMRDLFAIEGIKDYITKPFKAEELLQAIRRNLEKGKDI